MYLFKPPSSRFPYNGVKGLSPTSRTQIQCMDAGLRSVAGAQKIIEMIKSRKVVTKLILGHNELSDDGCILLFTFLNSATGRKHPVAEISLNSNGIGNRGLLAIAEYLEGNTTMTELFLQNNLFTADADTILRFTHSLNQSRLRSLSVTTNRLLADTFAQLFFSTVDSPYLRELHVSSICITHRSAAHIADFITSPRCRLQTLKCNGNFIGFRGVRNIIRAIETGNFTLLTVEMHSNSIALDIGSDDTEVDENDERHISHEAWKDGEALLKRVLMRNAHLKKQVEKEALELLVYSRALLLRFPERRAAKLEWYSSNTSPSSDLSRSYFAFDALPVELQFHILAFIAPILSPAQRANIISYASSPTTLPPLLPKLSTSSLSSSYSATRSLHEPPVFSMCIPDPSTNMGAGVDFAPTTSGSKGSMTMSSSSSGFSRAVTSGICSQGTCMGTTKSLVCNREQQRTQWLEEVGCIAYDSRLSA